MKQRRQAQRVIRRIVERLQADYQPVRVILFGSYADGKPHRDSDLDMLIVKQTRKPFHQRLFEVRQLVSPVLEGHPFDPIVMTPRELRRRLDRGDQFLRAIVRKGKAVYGARN